MKKTRKAMGEPKWRRVATELKKKARNKWWGRLVRLGVAVVVLGVIGAGVRDVVVLSRWDGKGRVNVVMAVPSGYVMSFDPGSETAMLVIFPDNLMVRAAYGYGEYRASALAGLDRQEKKRGRLVEDSVGDYLGVLVSGSVIRLQTTDYPEKLKRNGASRIQNKGDLVKLWREVLLRKLLGKRETNLSAWDLVRLLRGVGQVREDKLGIVNLGETAAVSETRLPDERVIYVTDEQRLTALTERWFVDEVLVKEEVAVIVVNTTGASGLGGRLARMLKVSGIQVVGVEDTTGDWEKSQVSVVDKSINTKATLKRLKQFLGVGSQVERKLRQDRADIMVYLGRDFQRRFFGE